MTTRRGGDQIIPRPPDWMVDGPPPWDGRVAELLDLDALLDVVARRGAGARMLSDLPDPRPSAVLIALFDDGAGPEVVLTRRNKQLRNHPGEVSFPGGRLDLDESPITGALREAQEEVGLDPASVQVVGELDHIATYVSNSLMIPVVARLTTRPVLRPNHGEVDRVFTVPLRTLLAPGVFRSERWRRDGGEFTVVFFELDDETVWGATARLLTQLLSLGTGVAR
ncbi:MAG: CoA pyrophosphatase [Acidimicrobiia bacterium]